MGKLDKLLIRLLSGVSDNNFNFNDLKFILLNLGFDERTTGGSHLIYTKKIISEIINIQPKGSKAKPYQVKQVRNLIVKYKLSNDGG